MPNTLSPAEAIKFKPMFPTFMAEISGVDFTDIDRLANDGSLDVIKEGIAKYGVLVFRKTGLDNERHIAFSRLFGELDDVTPYSQAGKVHRLPYDELFDVSNLDIDGNVAKPDSIRAVMNKGNTLFHADSAFNPRRAGLSLLLAHQIPPPGQGGETQFADSRTAYDDLPASTKEEIASYVTMNTMLHSRRMAAPESEYLKAPQFDPENGPMAYHSLVQKHEPSGRTNLYVTAHAYSIQGMDKVDAQKLLQELLSFATKDKYRGKVDWNNVGDLVMWDNTSVLHRAVPGEFTALYPRDMRRTTVHDGSSYAWGKNEVGATWRAGLP